MHPKLSVLVQVDLEGRHVTLAVTGVLTQTNQQALPPLVRRARTFFPHAHLTVDLQHTRLAEATAFKLLICSLQDQAPGGDPTDRGPTGRGSVQITAPAPLDQHTPTRQGSGRPGGHGPHRSPLRRCHPTTGTAPARHHTAGAPRGGRR